MGELTELTVDECLELLNGDEVGRVALCTPLGPRLVPVNYAMYQESIVFRTTPYSEMGTHIDGAEVVFEVDDLDYENHQGWSVLAKARAELVDDPDERAAIQRDWDPSPWAEGLRHLYVRLHWYDLTGRALGGEWVRPRPRERNRT